MIRNYIKIAWRNLRKYPTYSFINIFGLSMGIACFVLIGLHLLDEFTYDSMHKKSTQIYRVIETRTNENGIESKIAPVAYQISEKAGTLIPGIENTTRVVHIGKAIVSIPENANKNFYEEIWLANASFLDIFDFKLTSGNRSTVMNEPFSVIVTESSAIKLFGSTEVVGRSLKMDRDSVLYTITGVMENFSDNSHLDFAMLFSENSLYNDQYRNFINLDWASNNFHTYLQLAENANPEAVSEKINAVVQENRSEESRNKSNYSIQNLKDIHFNSEGIEENIGKPGNKQFSIILLIIGIFLLLIACINYINLSTARFSTRVKEIAIRKVTGALKKELIAQFLIEAVFLALISLIFALILVEAILPYFNSFMDKNLALNLFSNGWLVLYFIGLVLLVGLIAGSYPAFLQSRLMPFELLKNKINLGKGTLTMRKSLVVFQFTLSIVMIAATLVVYLQIRFLENTDMGFNKDRLLVMDINSGAVRSSALAIMDEMSNAPTVTSVSITSRVPGEWKGIPKTYVRSENKNAAETPMYFLGVDDRFASTFEIDFVNGENFSYNNQADSTAVLLNETAASMLGITSAEGQMIEIPKVDFYGNMRVLEQPWRVRVKGIIKDFNFQSLREPISPVVLGYFRNPIHRIDYFTAKISEGNQELILAEMERIIQSFDASHLLEYHFLDNQWDEFYKEDRRSNVMIVSSALITIIIACLGLLGLVSFSAQQRRKEIGIRKVLGASTTNITTILAQKFINNILIAIVISLPIAFFIMNHWLENYAFRIHIGWWFFIIPGATALIIAICTVIIQTLRAASSNPVDSLRSE